MCQQGEAERQYLLASERTDRLRYVPCEHCHGTGNEPPPYEFDWNGIPCKECGGSGIAHCCDGLREQPAPQRPWSSPPVGRKGG